MAGTMLRLRSWALYYLAVLGDSAPAGHQRRPKR